MLNFLAGFCSGGGRSQVRNGSKDASGIEGGCKSNVCKAPLTCRISCTHTCTHAESHEHENALGQQVSASLCKSESSIFVFFLVDIVYLFGKGAKGQPTHLVAYSLQSFPQDSGR